MSQKGEQHWMQAYWRPAMGWMYMLICLLDMAVFPVLWALLQATMHQQITQWDPLTLRGAGLFHIAMGAVLGIAAFGRTQEKLAGTASNPTATTSTQNVNMSGNTAGGFGSNQGGFGGSSGFGGNSGFGGPAAGGFGSSPSTGGFGTPTSGFGGSSFGSTPSTAPTSSFGSASTATPIVSSSGKLAPPPAQQPVL